MGSPHIGLKLLTVRSKSELRSRVRNSTEWTTQVPQVYFLNKEHLQPPTKLRYGTFLALQKVPFLAIVLHLHIQDELLSAILSLWTSFPYITVLPLFFFGNWKQFMSMFKGSFIGCPCSFTSLLLVFNPSPRTHSRYAWILLIVENLLSPKKTVLSSHLFFRDLKNSKNYTPTYTKLTQIWYQCWRKAILIYWELYRCHCNCNICSLRVLFQICVQLF